MKAQQQEAPTLIIETERYPNQLPSPTETAPDLPPLARWFANLPIKRKQLGALLLSELISIGGLSTLGALLLYLTGQRQLADQAKSELAVTQIGYFIKINQMGFGFRGQSDNVAIIEAAKQYSQKQPLKPELRQQVAKILQNEIKARQIEYATLVGNDGRVIVNAQENRGGQTFNPENLVPQVVKKPQQLKASAVVSRAELERENPPQWSKWQGNNALIRYTFTAVKDPQSQKVIGVLISGDIVNGKTPIVAQALNAFGAGYSAIYLREPKSGEFSLVSSLYLPQPGPLDKATPNLPLPDTRLLEQAWKNPGVPVSQRLQLNNQTYTVAAKTIPNLYREEATGPVPVTQEKPIAFLVRGTPETSLNALLRQSLLLQLGMAAIAMSVALALASLLRRAIVNPVENLQKITQRFAQGERLSRAQIFSGDEVGKLAATFNEMADSIVESEDLRERETYKKQLFAEIAQTKTADALHTPLEELLQELRSEWGGDHLLVYRFSPSGEGYIAAQTGTAPEVTPTNLNGERTVDNLSLAHLEPAEREYWESWGAKALLIREIRQNEAVFGFLIAYCQEPHGWSSAEKATLETFAQQLAQSLAGLTLLEQKQLEAHREAETNQRLQQELFNLLSDVEGAAQGDLTVRAEISAGQIGIVADFFNAILENLRDLVLRVKETAGAVNSSVFSNESAMRDLAQAAGDQAEQIQASLQALGLMSGAIEAVASNAQTAATISQQAASQAVTGGVAMEKTVDSIVQLRGTIAETAKKVKRLGESSQQISKVIALINQIALKTNLLAVNASIEAARAREEGRGFAVVAEEVGELAAQSATATKEIEQIVEAIQRETSEVVRAMELGTTQVVQGTQLVEQTKASLQEIVAVAAQVDQLLQTISTATVAQTSNSAAVNELMSAIAQVAQRTCQTSAEVASSLQGTVEIAQELQTSVATFKVE
jgi:twitching motility protein PilJ